MINDEISISFMQKLVANNLSVPGYSPSLLHSAEMLTPADFAPAPGRTAACPRCERHFATEEERKEHCQNSMRTVR
jgi:hypothetical protein